VTLEAEPAVESGPTHVYFYAIPPEGQGDPERFATLREARWYAQRQRGPGWAIEGRRESVGG